MFSHVHVNGYDELKKTLGGLAKDRRAFVLFTGGKDAATGKSWCPDCVTAEPHVEKAIESELSNGDSCFITCYVGDMPYWKDKENPFRTDEKFKINCIPTMIEWGVKGKRLIDEQLCNVHLLKDFFAED
ncbi:hypothetical protein QR680_014954 [Steinernema hermaphroditum]|uniref:Thioredoxin domain-containing protein 17 n=1 Tax=Steinernema hermaphroditum TaxID=289476 RepID=A0AA39IC30_9BILA|nr:hypothetical protein QR680_014954 [Steinernema hermaphroditum]